MSDAPPTLKDRIREAAERFGEWLDDALVAPQPELVPVRVRNHPQPRRPVRRRR